MTTARAFAFPSASSPFLSSRYHTPIDIHTYLPASYPLIHVCVFGFDTTPFLTFAQDFCTLNILSTYLLTLSIVYLPTIHTNSQSLSLFTLLTVLYYPLLSSDVRFRCCLVAYTLLNIVNLR
jgi:hypothetical protein